MSVDPAQTFDNSLVDWRYARRSRLWNLDQEAYLDVADDLIFPYQSSCPVYRVRTPLHRPQCVPVKVKMALVEI